MVLSFPIFQNQSGADHPLDKQVKGFLNLTLIITLTFILFVTLYFMIIDELRIFFARSKLRLGVLKELAEKQQIASFLAQKMKKHREVISRVFLDLQEKKLAICTNPKDPSFRYYKITKKGKEILEDAKKIFG